MDNNKIINSRIIHKHDIESNWKKAVNFIPLKAEIIVYDIDDNYNYISEFRNNGRNAKKLVKYIDELLDD